MCKVRVVSKSDGYDKDGLKSISTESETEIVGHTMVETLDAFYSIMEPGSKIGNIPVNKRASDCVEVE